MTIAGNQESRRTHAGSMTETRQQLMRRREDPEKEVRQFLASTRSDKQLTEAVARIVRELVRYMPNGPPGRSSGEQGQHILLDLEVDDVRCLLIRRGQPSPMELLSPREQEIARMAAIGYPNKAIAAVLEISSWTVSSHLRRVFVKLGVCSRAAMATRIAGDDILIVESFQGTDAE